MYKFVMEPFKHQYSGISLYRGNTRYGFFDEQGCGKSKVVVDASNLLFLDKSINAIIIICPNTVKSTWANPEWGQIAIHTPKEFRTRIHQIDLSRRLPHIDDLVKQGKRPSSNDGPLWIVVNYEAVRQDFFEQWLAKFMTGAAPVALVLDESTRIKNPRAQQTKAILRLGKYASRKYILTGTPMAKNPLDIYSQMNFLDPSILQCPSFVAFRSQFAIMGGYCVGGKPVQVVGWKNLDRLQEKIAHCSRVVRKKDVLPDLPDKLYTKIELPLSAEQAEAYRSMKAYAIAQFPESLTKSVAPIAITKILRLTQITSGFLGATDNDYSIAKAYPSNPKQDFIIDLLEGTEHVVVFGIFKFELEALYKRLEQEGISCAMIHGEVKNKEREQHIQDFQQGNIRVLICQVVTGGIGITLTKAHTAVYISNPYSYESRAQSEDRLHRPGQHNNVTYYDLLATCDGKPTIDHTVLEVLKEKKDLSDVLLGRSINEIL